MKDHPFVLHPNQTGISDSASNLGPADLRPARRRVLVLAAVLLVELLLVTTTVLINSMSARSPCEGGTRHDSLPHRPTAVAAAAAAGA